VRGFRSGRYRGWTAAHERHTRHGSRLWEATCGAHLLISTEPQRVLRAPGLPFMHPSTIIKSREVFSALC
jgi:hypothetical protein